MMDKNQLLSKLHEITRIDELTGCWLFIGSHNEHGYGQLIIAAYPYKVHRLSAWIYLGLDLNNSQVKVLHRIECLNRNCWNPEHLYLGTQLDNVRDSMEIGTHQNGNNGNRREKNLKTHCVNGHEMTEENSYIYKNRREGCKICRLNNDRNKRQRHKQFLKKLKQQKKDTNKCQ